MNDQEIFNTVVNHLRQQGKRSVRVNGGIITCLYRGPNNTKCAVGCLISDEDYSADIEGKGIHVLVSRELLPENLKWMGDPQALVLLRNLQAVHDEVSIENWESNFEFYAHKYKLSLPESK